MPSAPTAPLRCGIKKRCEKSQTYFHFLTSWRLFCLSSVRFHWIRSISCCFWGKCGNMGPSWCLWLDCSLVFLFLFYKVKARLLEKRLFCFSGEYFILYTWRLVFTFLCQLDSLYFIVFMFLPPLSSVRFTWSTFVFLFKTAGPKPLNTVKILLLISIIVSWCLWFHFCHNCQFLDAVFFLY